MTIQQAMQHLKQGRRGTVIEATSRKDRKLKVMFKIMIQKNTD